MLIQVYSFETNEFLLNSLGWGFKQISGHMSRPHTNVLLHDMLRAKHSHWSYLPEAFSMVNTTERRMKEDDGFQDFHQTLDVHENSHDCSSHFKAKHLYAPFLRPVEELDAGSPSVCLAAALVARTASQPEQNCSLNSSNVKSQKSWHQPYLDFLDLPHPFQTCYSLISYRIYTQMVDIQHLLTGTGGGIERDHIGLAAKNAPGKTTATITPQNNICNICKHQFQLTAPRILNSHHQDHQPQYTTINNCQASLEGQAMLRMLCSVYSAEFAVSWHLTTGITWYHGLWMCDVTDPVDLICMVRVTARSQVLPFSCALMTAFSSVLTKCKKIRDTTGAKVHPVPSSFLSSSRALDSGPVKIWIFDDIWWYLDDIWMIFEWYLNILW